MAALELELPVRPYVPPTAFCAAGACASAALLLDGGWLSRASACIVPAARLSVLVVAGMVLVLVGAWFKHRTADSWETARKVVVCLGAGLLIGCVSSSLWLVRWQYRASKLEGMPASACHVVVQGDPNIGDYGVSSTADLYDGKTGAYLAPVRMTSDEAYEAGTVLEMVGRLEPLGENEWARSRFMKGEAARLRAVHIIDVDRARVQSAVGAIRRCAFETIEPERDDARALLAGTICGRTTELAETGANDAFFRCGLSHLVAVSGSHLACISLLLDTALRWLHVGNGSRRVSVLAVMTGYVVFSGCAPSAIRSVLMVGAGMATTLFRRRTHPLSGLSLTVTVLVALNPGLVYDLGFQLSALSVLFLLVFGRYAAYLLMRLGIPRVLAEPLSLTLVAQWATLPLTLSVFGELSVVAPLANVIVGPVMSALLVAGLVTVPISMLPFCSGILAIPDVLARGSIFLTKVFEGIPYASMVCDAGWWMPFVAYGAAVVVYVTWKAASRRAMAFALSIVGVAMIGSIIRWTVLAPPSVTVLDVGQADAILVRDGSHTLLVDAGVDSEAATALARNHVLHLDAVVITHWDRDHWGGLPDILESIPVEQIIVADGARAAMPEELRAYVPETFELADGDVLRVGDFVCRMVWPDDPVAGEENADSLCLDVSYIQGDKTLDMLLTGDTERDELAAYADEVGDVDVLKVGHHGSHVSVTEELLDVLKPEIALASAGEGNSYGHPDGECVHMIEDAGALFFCTKDVGDIIVYPGERGPRVETRKRSVEGEE